jgi:hypothetical protein
VSNVGLVHGSHIPFKLEIPFYDDICNAPTSNPTALTTVHEVLTLQVPHIQGNVKGIKSNIYLN